MTATCRTILAGASRLLLASCLSLLMAAGAHADCLKWDVNGRWHFVQSNDTSARVDLQRSGNALSGSAYFAAVSNDLAIATNGSVDGTIDGARVDIVVYWDNGSIGVYEGRIDGSGSMQGSTYDRSAPQTTATWRSDRNASCVSESETMPGSKPALALGRVQLPAAGCALWNISGDWWFYQNNRSWPQFSIQQDQNTLTGSGEHLLNRGVEQPGHTRGPINGRIVGNHFDFTARWDVGRVGVYTGVVSDLGRLSGSTYDQDDPSKRAEWTSDGKATCLVANAGPSAAAPRSLCEAARSARARNSPAAPGLEAQCRQIGERSSTPGAAPAPAPTRAPVTQAELDRLAAIGQNIARTDYAVGSQRRVSADPAYRYGFDVATAIFGDPALGAKGNTAVGPGSLNIRAGLDLAGQQGFDDSMNYHFSRTYAH